MASQSECERCFKTYTMIFTYIFRYSGLTPLLTLLLERFAETKTLLLESFAVLTLLLESFAVLTLLLESFAVLALLF